MSAATRSATAAPIVIPFMGSSGRSCRGRLRSLLFAVSSSVSAFRFASAVEAALPCVPAVRPEVLSMNCAHGVTGRVRQ